MSDLTGKVAIVTGAGSGTWFQGMIPLGRLQEPEDIGEMVAFLASERARNTTASAFNVAGGMGPI